jgi:hypothetical protein
MGDSIPWRESNRSGDEQLTPPMENTLAATTALRHKKVLGGLCHVLAERSRQKAPPGEGISRNQRNNPMRSKNTRQALQDVLLIAHVCKGLHCPARLKALDVVQWLLPYTVHALMRFYCPSEPPGIFRRASDIGRSASRVIGTGSPSAFGLRIAG